MRIKSRWEEGHSYLSEAKHTSVVAGICSTPFVWYVISVFVLFFCLLVLLLSSETPRSSFKIRTCVQVRAHTRSFQLSVFPVFVISSQCIPRAKLQWSGTCNTASNCRHVKRMLDKNRWEHHNFSEFVFLSETETCISQFTQYRCFEIKRLMNGTSELRSHRHCVKVVVKRPENLQTKRELW